MGATCNGDRGFFGAASSEAEIGFLHGLARLTGVQPNAGASTATAEATFSDALTIPGSGDFDRFVFHMSLTGGYAGSSTQAGAGEVVIDAAGPVDTFHRIVSASPADFIGTADGSTFFDIALVMRTGIVNSNPFDIQMTVIAQLGPKGGSMTPTSRAHSA
jgi:hypothetical protein